MWQGSCGALGYIRRLIKKYTRIIDELNKIHTDGLFPSLSPHAARYAFKNFGLRP
jgi:hypothetical protein